MNLPAKYKKLKTSVGGNREKDRYEETFGMPLEEFHKVTPPNRYIRRILAETEFSIRLSKQLGGKYDAVIDGALDAMLSAVDREGVLTKETALAGEQMLMPLSQDAKEYSLILAAHAHIDMNWMWAWHETVASTIATFQTMLALLREYPDFHFSQSQAAVYKIIDDYAPELKPEIQRYIREGRWEVTASAWVETDKNMPSTGSLLEHIHQTKKYLRDEWDIAPEKLNIDFSPDTFGHSAFLPELDALGGVDYYYHCRGLDGDNALYRWRAPSGREMIVYREQYWYNSGITPLPGIGLIDVSNRSGGLKTGLVVYGVGDHGGGPTRRDLERALDMMQWPVFPSLRFGTFGEFFKEAETVRENLPLLDRELNFIMPGCYTTQSRIKLGNRKAESALYDAQLWDTFAKTRGVRGSREKQFDDAWRSVLFTHFHDILTGSCVQDSREHAMGEITRAVATAESRASLAMQGIASQIDTSDIVLEDTGESQSEGAGAGYGVEQFGGMPAPERGNGKTRIYHLFNSASLERRQACEITVWDWVGDLRDIAFTGPGGEELEFQLVDTALQQYWDHKYFRVLVRADIPAFGYTTVVLREKEPEEYRFYLQPQERSHKPSRNIILENRYIRAEFSYQSGELLSLMDLENNKELLDPKDSGGLRVIDTERDSSSSWVIGHYKRISAPLETLSLKPFTGNLVSGFTMKQRYGISEITSVISLEKDRRHFTVKLTADWHEVAGDSVPLLVYRIPTVQAEQYLYDVPGGVQYRAPMDLDVPGLQYGAAVYEKKLLGIVSDCKYGYRGTGSSLSLSLIHSTRGPDPYPERGIHQINLFVGVWPNEPADMAGTAFRLTHAVPYQSGKAQPGPLQKTGAFLKADLGTAVFAGLKTLNGQVLVQLYEADGKSTQVKFSGKVPFQKSCRCDLMGNPLDTAVKAADNRVSWELKPYESIALLISF